MTGKIDFFIRCRAGGGYVARSQAPVMEAEGETLSALRAAVKRVVRAKLGGDCPFSLLVGQGAAVRRIAVAAVPANEISIER